MPYREPDPDDPMELVSVPLPLDDVELHRVKAECLAEEFLRMGHDAPSVLRLFENPMYTGTHELYQRLGAPWIRDMVERTALLFRPIRPPQEV